MFSNTLTKSLSMKKVPLGYELGVGRVFIIAQPTISRNGHFPDVATLAEHGEVITIVESGIHPFEKPSKAIDALFHRLEDFDRLIDKVVWVGGDTLAAIIAGAVLSELNIPWFWYLKYERYRSKEDGHRLNTGYYRPKKIQIYEEEALGE